jgi:hypothetical protein
MCLGGPRLSHIPRGVSVRTQFCLACTPGNSQSNKSLRYSGPLHPQCSLVTPNERATAFFYKTRKPSTRQRPCPSFDKGGHSPKTTLMK